MKNKKIKNDMTDKEMMDFLKPYHIDAFVGCGNDWCIGFFALSKKYTYWADDPHRVWQVVHDDDLTLALKKAIANINHKKDDLD